MDAAIAAAELQYVPTDWSLTLQTYKLFQTLKVVRSLIFSMPVSVCSLFNSPSFLLICETALVWFDYILTLRKEIDYVWSRKLRASTIIFALTRYPLLANVLYLFAVTDKLKKVCRLRLS